MRERNFMKSPFIFPSAVLLSAVSLSLACAPDSSAQSSSGGNAAPTKSTTVKPASIVAKPATTTVRPTTGKTVTTVTMQPADNGTTPSSAVTDPVGFITLSVAGTHNATGSALSFLGQGMTRPVEYASAATGTATSTLTDSNASWTDDQFNTVTANNVTTGNPYYVELTSGTGVGLWADIVSTNGKSTQHSGTADSLTLSADLSPYITAGTTYKIRKNWTPSAFFGPDPTAAGASGLAGGTSTTADQVLLYTPAVYNSSGNLVTAAVYKSYYYQTAGFGGTGWRSSTDSFTDASNTKFEPTSGILVQRLQATDLNFALVGAVKMGTTDLPVARGLNFVSNPYPVSSITLGTSGLYNPSDSAGNTLASGSSTTADQVLIYVPATYNNNGSQLTAATYNQYYYQTQGFGGTGWRSTMDSFSDASGTVIPLGQSILIQRLNKTVASDGSFEWVSTQPF